MNSLQQSINELSAAIDKNIALIAKQREDINTLLDACEEIVFLIQNNFLLFAQKEDEGTTRGAQGYSKLVEVIAKTKGKA